MGRNDGKNITRAHVPTSGTIRYFGQPSGAWGDYDLIHFRDGKTRRIKSGCKPLVAGLPAGMVPCGDPSLSDVENTAEARVMRLHGYGNSIVPQLAAEFIRAAMNL